MSKFFHSGLGFTLLELLLSVSAIAVISAASLPLYVRLQTDTDLTTVTSTFAGVLRRAQTLSQASDGDTAWGVYLQSGSMTLFKGASYATRDSSYDETTDLGTNMTITGTNEYVFTKTFGELSTAGSTTLTSVDNTIASVTVNTKGIVSY